MTETKPIYSAGQEPVIHRCSNCMRPFGVEVADGGLTILLFGHLRMRYLDADCKCGQRLHWRSDDRRLEHLVRAGATIQECANAELDVLEELILKLAKPD